MSQNPYPNYNMQMNPELMHQFQNMQMQNEEMMQAPHEETVEDISGEALDKLIIDALSYYFSEENLNKDYYMRSIMNNDGFVEANAVTTFNK